MIRNLLKLSLPIFFVLEIIFLLLVINNNHDLYTAVSIIFLANAVAVLVVEITFRWLFKKKTGSAYVPVKKVSIDQIHIQPHPYLPYEYKEGFVTPPRASANYPLHPNRFSFPQLKTGNLRHMDGENGSRPMLSKSSKDEVKVVCLGASTTGNYIQEGENIYSYPLLLEEKLKERHPDKNITVHNCGHGGWTSAEVLINFALKVYDLKPDFVIIYHAYNDLQAGLTPNFRSDYSHYRKNFGEESFKLRFSKLVPDLPLHFYNYILHRVFPWMNPRFGLLQVIKKGQPDLSREFQSIESLSRNLEHIVKICKASGIQPIVSTFAHHLYKDIENSPVHLKYRSGLIKENTAIRKMAEKHGIPLVDYWNLVPKSDEYFVDSIHFTPKGMDLLAESFASEISKELANQLLVN